MSAKPDSLKGLCPPTDFLWHQYSLLLPVLPCPAGAHACLCTHGPSWVPLLRCAVDSPTHSYDPAAIVGALFCGSYVSCQVNVTNCM